jgi:hypothetical protein
VNVTLRQVIEARDALAAAKEALTDVLFGGDVSPEQLERQRQKVLGAWASLDVWLQFNCDQIVEVAE